MPPWDAPLPEVANSVGSPQATSSLQACFFVGSMVFFLLIDLGDFVCELEISHRNGF